MTGVSDAEVIARSLREPEAFGLLFDRHAATLQRFLDRRLGPAGAEGLVGEVFRVAFERRAKFDASHQSARPRLYGIATHLLARHRRAEARRLRAAARLACEPAAGVPQEAASALEARALLARAAAAIAALPPEERDSLLLYVWEDLGYEEVAAVLEVPVGTVRSRLNRARRRLRTMLEEP